MSHFNRALVLTGGGARGAYQAGVLKYLGENIPEAHFETLVGSSSGAINVAGLASAGGSLAIGGPEISRLWSELTMREVFRTDAISLSKIGAQWLYSLLLGGLLGKPGAHSLVDTTPLRRLLERVYRPEDVRAALQSGDRERTALFAHALKGNAGLVGASRAAAQARALEQAARGDLCGDLAPLTRRLEAALTEALQGFAAQGIRPAAL